jgi:protein phosphatase
MVAIFDHLAQVANVGDSRTYHWLAPELTQLTRDHSYVAELVENGLIRAEEAANHPKGNILLRALGTDPTVKVDLFALEVHAGDKLLLCSDGFWKAFPDTDELAGRFSQALSAVDLCRVLAAESYNRSGTDDTSLAIVLID